MDGSDYQDSVQEDLSLGEEEDSAGSRNPTVRKAINLKLKPLKSKERRESKSMELVLGNSSTSDSPGKDVGSSAKKLTWNHQVLLTGEKVIDPLIHCCEQCLLPILIYGRMIPCKHVYCLDCARKTSGVCARCADPVQRIEECALGTVFLCTFGGAKHGVSGCRRTYLSHRDLQAHVTHRHLKQQQQPLLPPPAMAVPQHPLHMFGQAAATTEPPPVLDGRALSQPRVPPPGPAFLHPVHHRVNITQMPPSGGAAMRTDPRETFNIPLVRTSSNLITIPIQDDVEFSGSSSTGGGTFQQHHYGQQAGLVLPGVAPQYPPAAMPYPGGVASGQSVHPAMMAVHHGLPPPHLGQAAAAGIQQPVPVAHQQQGAYVPVPTQVTSQWSRQPPQQQHGMQPYY